MEDKKRGGVRKGAGRKPVAEEKKVNSLFTQALKELYKVDVDDEAKVMFIKDKLLESQRGQIFVAEHVFGKAKEVVETTHNINDFKIKDLFKFDNTKE